MLTCCPLLDRSRQDGGGSAGGPVGLDQSHYSLVGSEHQRDDGSDQGAAAPVNQSINQSVNLIYSSQVDPGPGLW